MAIPKQMSLGNILDVGAFEAKTYFSELLRKVQGGAIVNISKNGKRVAVLLAADNVQNKTAIEAHKRILERGKKIAQIRKASGIADITKEEIKELKDAGRKY